MIMQGKRRDVQDRYVAGPLQQSGTDRAYHGPRRAEPNERNKEAGCSPVSWVLRKQASHRACAIRAAVRPSLRRAPVRSAILRSKPNLSQVANSPGANGRFGWTAATSRNVLALMLVVRSVKGSTPGPSERCDEQQRAERRTPRPGQSRYRTVRYGCVAGRTNPGRD